MNPYSMLRYVRLVEVGSELMVSKQVPYAVPFPSSVDVRRYSPVRLVTNLGNEEFLKVFMYELAGNVRDAPPSSS